MGIYYLENIPWMWFMTFCALFILKNWAVVWGGERNYLVSILLNNQMDNYKLIQFTDNKILFFIVIKITILSSTLYVIVLLYLKYLILMWPMSSKYVILSIYRVTSNFTFHQNVDVYNIVFDCDWLAISLFLWVYDRKTSWQNSKDLMGERRCGWKTHITKKRKTYYMVFGWKT